MLAYIKAFHIIAVCPFASLVPEVVRVGLAKPDLGRGPGYPV